MKRSAHSPWLLLGLLLLLLLAASVLLAHLIAWCSHIRRERRIRAKTRALASDQQSPAQAKPVPVTIVTGFLGAGKTTLLNRILRTPDLPYKLMVLENELGSISIDHSLLHEGESSEDSGIYVLQNGCMCCTARAGTSSSSELERILDYLLRITNENGFDYLVVETTGLADPGPIVETFLQLRASRFRLDAIVTIVDAHNAQRFWDAEIGGYAMPIELQRQLLYADIVALNKTDLLADAGELKRLQHAISVMNEEATQYECVNAQVDLDQIINVNTFDAIKFRDAHLDNSPAGERLKAMHTGGINTVHFDVEQDVDLQSFGDWLTRVVAQYAKAHVLRVKGVLAIANDPRRCIVQCVLDTYTIAPSSVWRENEPRRSKLVLIGKDLDREQLQRNFLSCLVAAEGKKTV